MQRRAELFQGLLSLNYGSDTPPLGKYCPCFTLFGDILENAKGKLHGERKQALIVTVKKQVSSVSITLGLVKIHPGRHTAPGEFACDHRAAISLNQVDCHWIMCITC